VTDQLDPGTLTVVEVGREHLADLASVLREPLVSVLSSLDEHGGLLAYAGDRPVGALLFAPHGDLLGMRRVTVPPDVHGQGVAGALVGAAERVARERGYEGLGPAEGIEPSDPTRFWEHLGYARVDPVRTGVAMLKVLPVHRVAETADEARALGERLAGVLRAGDLVILTGDLGAGKTTFTQGVGAGLRVRGSITSPTFVIARVHPSLVGGPSLVHVDAYRLGGLAELDDLDLDTALDEVVTVVEWGEGIAEGLAQARLEVTITRARGGDPLDADDSRQLRFAPVGCRWIGTGLRAALA